MRSSIQAAIVAGLKLGDYTIKHHRLASKPYTQLFVLGIDGYARVNVRLYDDRCLVWDSDISLSPGVLRYEYSNPAFPDNLINTIREIFNRANNDSTTDTQK